MPAILSSQTHGPNKNPMRLPEPIHPSTVLRKEHEMKKFSALMTLVGSACIMTSALLPILPR